MKLTDLIEQSQPNEGRGTYAAVKFDQDTLNLITKYIKDNNIPNGVPETKIHCTLLYSRKFCPEYEPLGMLKNPLTGTPTRLDVWNSKPKTDGSDPSKCLVIEFNSPELVERHNALMKEHDATYDFPDYKTHITLSYDIGDVEVSDLTNVVEAIPKLTIVEEYGEDLDLDWASKI